MTAAHMGKPKRILARRYINWYVRNIARSPRVIPFPLKTNTNKRQGAGGRELETNHLYQAICEMV